MPEPGIKPGKADNIVWRFNRQSLKGDIKENTGWESTKIIVEEKMNGGLSWVATEATSRA
jgi:hypothetical protein